MKFDREHREAIRRYILERIDNRQKNIAGATAAAFGISEMTVYRYLKELSANRVIEKNDRGYRLVANTKTYLLPLSQEDAPREEKIYTEYIDPLMERVPDNVRHIWTYCFTEMMNNVIDHSGATQYRITVSQNHLHTRVVLGDNGIGIFKKISDHYGFSDPGDAIAELFKGKLTTDRIHHSGEGIFFSSQLMDIFGAFSEDRVFTRSKFTEFQGRLPQSAPADESFQQGTFVFMQLSNFSNKTTKELFDRFSDDNGNFIRTQIPVKNLFDTYPVSRSQAKRLCQRFDAFRIVELDFTDVPEIGQGFAHELFSVYQSQHPDVRLVPVNDNEDVRKMINHVKADN